MDKQTAIQRIEAADNIKEEIYVGIFPKSPLICDLCKARKNYLFRDIELEMDLCGACQQFVDKLRNLPDEILQTVMAL